MDSPPVDNQPLHHDHSKILNFFSSHKEGLSQSEAAARLKKEGLNELEKNSSKNPILIFLSQLQDWLVIILILASALSFFLGERIESMVILAIVLLSAGFGFIQEYRADKTLEKLKKFITHKAKVLRDGTWTEIDGAQLCVGDVVKLRIGDRVPGDMWLLELDGLTIDESILTGESMPQEKAVARFDGHLPKEKKKNMAYAGTYVAGGTGLGIVIAIGKNTKIGTAAKALEKDAPPTDFQKQIKNFSGLLFKVVVVLVVFVFGTNALLGKGIWESFLFAVALAVGITPELLPMIITVTLSRGAMRMAKNKAVVKRLISVEDFGNIDTLCSDKTGTLTTGVFTLSEYLDAGLKVSDSVLLYGLICTSNFTQGGKPSNELDKALWKSKFGDSLKNKTEGYKLVDENEFDFERRKMSVLVSTGGKKLLIVKGAPEQVFASCKNVSKEILDAVKEHHKSSHRVLAVASKTISKTTSSLHDEKDLELTGILVFKDPLKSDVKESLELFQKLGVRIKIISGDSPEVVANIAHEVGLESTQGKVITGEDLAKLTPKEFDEYAENYALFARITPDQKRQIVASLNREGHIVGYLGDGVNDAPALKAADVGIAVNTGAEVAKEAADIVLLEKDLKVLGNGIEQGRRTFGNITKYILNTISANYGNMLTVALSSLFLPFIPLLPSQILLNNFISDIPLLAITTDNVDSQFVKKPKRWNIGTIGKFMLYFGLISSAFDFATILPLIFVWHLAPEGFRTAWFIESAISEMVVTFAIRTRLPFYKSKPSTGLIILSVLSIFAVIIIPLTSLGMRLFDFSVLSPVIFGWIAVVLIAYFAITEIAKGFFFKKFEY